MQKKFLVNLTLLFLLNLFIKPFWIFGIDRVVQNTVNETDYGIYFTLFNFSMLFAIFLDLGLTGYNNRTIAQNNWLLSKYVPAIVSFKVGLSFIYFFITFLTGYWLGYDAFRFHLLLWLSINQTLLSAMLYMRSNISALQLYKTDSWLSVLDKTLMIVFGVFMLYGNLFSITIMNFIYIQTLAYFITLLVVCILLFKKTHRFAFRIKLPLFIVILKQTLPYALLVLVMTLYYRLDAIMLDFMLDDGTLQTSIYAQAYRIMDAATQIGVLSAGLLLPMFSRMLQQKKEVASLVRLSFKLIFVPSVVVTFMLYAFSGQIMDVLYPGHSGSAEVVLQVLMCCFMSIAMTYIYGTLLTANGNLKLLNILCVGGLLLNLCLNWWLIPEYKSVGSAMASLITQFLIVVIQVIAVYRIFRFSIDLALLFRVLLYCASLFAALFLVKTYFLAWVTQLLALLFVSICLAFLYKLVQIKEIKEILADRQ